MKRMYLYVVIFCFALMTGTGCEKTTPDDDGTGGKIESEYDIEFQATKALGVYYYEPEYMGELSNFILTMADVEIYGNAEHPSYEGDGNAVSLNIYANASKVGVLPAGEYDFVPKMEGDPLPGTFTREYSYYTQTNADGSKDEFIEFTTANLEVSETADAYTVELTATLPDGKTLRATYSGNLEFVLSEGGDDDLFPPMDHNTTVTFIDYKAYYYGVNDSGAAHFDFQLTDFVNDGINYNGNVLFLRMFSEATDGNMPAAGNYTVAANIEDEHAGAITPGYIDVGTLQNKGTNLMYSKLDGEYYISQYGFVKSGTVNVAVSGDTYTIAVNLIDQKGYKIEGTYSGKLNIVDRSYNSTLTEDHVVNVTGLPCEIGYFGQYYIDKDIDGENWTIYIMNEKDGTEGLQIDLIAPNGGGYAGKLPVGKYTVTKTYPAESYMCIPGELDGADLYCSWWLGAYSGGAAYMHAPFTGGHVEVTKSDKTYTIKVDVYDDAPIKHHITGEWTGVPVFYDGSVAENSITHKTSKSASVKSVPNRYETKVPYRIGYTDFRK